MFDAEIIISAVSQPPANHASAESLVLCFRIRCSCLVVFRQRLLRVVDYIADSTEMIDCLNNVINGDTIADIYGIRFKNQSGLVFADKLYDEFADLEKKAFSKSVLSEDMASRLVCFTGHGTDAGTD